MNRMACVLSVGLLLAACGTTPEDRGVSGAGIGAAGGAIIGAITGLSVLEAAALGAVGGALTGLLTDDKQLNFGEPIWKRFMGPSQGESAQNTRHLTSDPQLVAGIQSKLSGLGYDPGPVDGAMGPRTTEAIRLYQKDNSLLTDGRPTVELAQHIDLRFQ